MIVGDILALFWSLESFLDSVCCLFVFGCWKWEARGGKGGSPGSENRGGGRWKSRFLVPGGSPPYQCRGRTGRSMTVRPSLQKSTQV